jgi:glucose/arabinose dehydrogenase
MIKLSIAILAIDASGVGIRSSLFYSGMVSGGEPTPFLSGLVPSPAGSGVYGRPVGVAVDQAGSLLISDDGSKTHLESVV